MTFEIVLSIYTGGLLVYGSYVLVKIIRIRRKNEQERKEFTRRRPNQEYWDQGGNI